MTYVIISQDLQHGSAKIGELASSFVMVQILDSGGRRMFLFMTLADGLAPQNHDKILDVIESYPWP